MIFLYVNQFFLSIFHMNYSIHSYAVELPIAMIC